MTFRKKVNPERIGRFLAALSEGDTIKTASQMSGVSWNRWYEERKTNPEFAAAWEDAVERGTQTLEQEARRRAHDGVDEPVFYKGAPVGVVRKYSDTLLVFLLKARRPEVYRDNIRVTYEDAEVDRLADEHGLDREAVRARLRAIEGGRKAG